MSLLEIVYDLLHKPQVRKAFNADPLSTVVPYDLDQKKQSALFSMDPLRIAEEIQGELAGEPFAFLKKEFPACTFPQPEGATAEYPAPTPLVLSISPTRRAAADGPFELKIYGQSFDPEAVFRLKGKEGARDLIPSAHDVKGTFRCSEAFGTIVPVPGKYEVVLRNSVGKKHEVVVEGADGVSLEVEIT
jgi:hypothetical protein